MAVKEYGDINTWDFIATSSTQQHPSLNTSVADKYYFPYLKTGKCKYSADITSQAGIGYININNNKYICLPDGVVLYGNTLPNGYFGSRMYVDLNGKKGPNIMGNDIFMFTINRPVYKSDDYNTSSYRVLSKCPVGISTCFGGTAHGEGGYYWEGDEETMLKLCTGELGDGYTIASMGNSCAFMIEQAGWKFPKNYPVKL